MTGTEFQAFLKRVSDVSLETGDSKEQAKRLGITTYQLYHYRTKAKLAGYRVIKTRSPIRQNPAADRLEGRGAEIVAQMTTVCARCGLRGPHECISVERITNSNPGAVYPPEPPLTMGWERRKPDGTESIYMAAKRVGIAVDALSVLLMNAGIERPAERSKWRIKRTRVDKVIAEARK